MQGGFSTESGESFEPRATSCRAYPVVGDRHRKHLFLRHTGRIANVDATKYVAEFLHVCRDFIKLRTNAILCGPPYFFSCASLGETSSNFSNILDLNRPSVWSIPVTGSSLAYTHTCTRCASSVSVQPYPRDMLPQRYQQRSDGAGARRLRQHRFGAEIMVRGHGRGGDTNARCTLKRECGGTAVTISLIWRRSDGAGARR